MKVSSITKTMSVLLALLFFSGAALADAAEPTFGTVAYRIAGSFGAIAKLITAVSYLAGLGFAVGAIMKFKQHKDNPTQIPVGTPVALIFIAAALLFLPSILKVTGATIFDEPEAGGPRGVIPFDKEKPKP